MRDKTCKHCGHKQKLSSDVELHDPADPAAKLYFCSRCGVISDPEEKAEMLTNAIDTHAALTMIEGALERLEVIKILLTSQVGSPFYLDLSNKQMSSGLHGLIDAICEDIGEGHHHLTEAVKRYEATTHAI